MTTPNDPVQRLVEAVECESTIREQRARDEAEYAAVGQTYSFADLHDARQRVSEALAAVQGRTFVEAVGDEQRIADAHWLESFAKLIRRRSEALKQTPAAEPDALHMERIASALRSAPPAPAVGDAGTQQVIIAISDTPSCCDCGSIMRHAFGMWWCLECKRTQPDTVSQVGPVTGVATDAPANTIGALGEQTGQPATPASATGGDAELVIVELREKIDRLEQLYDEASNIARANGAERDALATALRAANENNAALRSNVEETSALWQAASSARDAALADLAAARAALAEEQLNHWRERLNYLEECNRNAPGWGAAVGAREEECRALRFNIARATRSAKGDGR